jgi:hypothetical protein
MLHAAAVAGVQARFVVAGVIGIVGGLLVPALVRPTPMPAPKPAADKEPADVAPS